VLIPKEPAELRAVLPWLLAPEQQAARCIWVQALSIDSAGREEQPWAEAWGELFLRSNERRDALRRHLKGGLVLVAPMAMKVLVREAAPDLWSVRSIVIELVPDAPSQEVQFVPEESGEPKLEAELAPDPDFWMEQAERRQQGSASQAEAFFQAAAGFRSAGRLEEGLAASLKSVEMRPSPLPPGALPVLRQP